MKKLFSTIAGTLAFLPVFSTQAWTYNDGDVLLIFRESTLPNTYPSSFYDVEFDLGSVNNFLGHPAGYSTTVTGFDLSQVQAVYGNDLTGVSVILAAATSPTNANPLVYLSAALPQTAWLNGVEPYNTAYNVSPSVWQGIWSKINAVGTRPGLYLPTSQQTAAYSFPPSSVLSYDGIISSGSTAAGRPNGFAIASGSDGYVYADWLPQFGGYAPFTVEGVAPGSFGFLAVAPSTVSPRPLDAYIGTFTITAGGTLTFVAGPPAPVVTGITHSRGASTVSFSTTLSGTYSLVYTNNLGSATNWAPIAGGLVGDGNTDSLDHVDGDSVGFYRVIRTP